MELLWLSFPALGAVFYLLYRRGIAVTKRITAVFFSFRPGRSEDRAALNACTGWVRHVGRFGESGGYTFVLDCRLSKGGAAVSLLDEKKQELLRLDCRAAAGRAELHRGRRYYLRWEFQSATGVCALRWKNDPTI